MRGLRDSFHRSRLRASYIQGVFLDRHCISSDDGRECAEAKGDVDSFQQHFVRSVAVQGTKNSDRDTDFHEFLELLETARGFQCDLTSISAATSSADTR